MGISKGDLLQATQAYEVPLKTSDGRAVTLKDFIGSKPLVLFHYPKANTGGCTKEVCKFRDEYEVFKQAGAEVVGFSGDSPETNAEFAKNQRLQYTLLSDDGGMLRKALGIQGNLFGLVPGRETLVFDQTGKCILKFNNQMKAEKHTAEAMRVIKELQQKQQS